jgi:hypothetical protein
MHLQKHVHIFIIQQETRIRLLFLLASVANPFDNDFDQPIFKKRICIVIARPVVDATTVSSHVYCWYPDVPRHTTSCLLHLALVPKKDAPRRERDTKAPPPSDPREEDLGFPLENPEWIDDNNDDAFDKITTHRGCHACQRLDHRWLPRWRVAKAYRHHSICHHMKGRCPARSSTTNDSHRDPLPMIIDYSYIHCHPPSFMLLLYLSNCNMKTIYMSE